MKRSQVTVFVILGILILFVAVLYESSKKSPEVTLVPASHSAQNIVNRCLREAAGDAIYAISLRGGVYFPKDYSLNIFEPTQIYAGSQNAYVPNKIAMESFLAQYAQNKLLFCLDAANFSMFAKTATSPMLNVSLSNNTALFDLYYPITETQGSMQKTTSDFSYVQKTSMLRLQSIAMQYVEEQKKYKDRICMSCLLKLAQNNSIVIESHETNTESVFLLIDNSTRFENLPSVFAFGIRYEEIK